MYVLDTDHITIIQLETGWEFKRLAERLDRIDAHEIASTIVSYEEQARGWTSYVSRARSVAQLVEAYRRMERHLESWRRTPALAFDARAAVEYQRLLRLRVRIGSMDLRIAAIVLANGATLLTRNLRDFRQVPNLQAEDWTA